MVTAGSSAGAGRVARLSQAMMWVTTVGIVLIVVLMGLAFMIPEWSRNLLLNRLGATGGKLPLGPTERVFAAMICAVPIGVMVWGLWHVRTLFSEFAQGRMFTAAAARHLRQFGVSVLIQGPLGPLTATALGLVLSLGNPPGQRYLVLTLSINDYYALIVGGVLVAVASLMREAARLADENASFV